VATLGYCIFCNLNAVSLQ